MLNNTADEAILLRLVDFIVTATSTNNDDECGLKEFKNKFYSNVLNRVGFWRIRNIYFLQEEVKKQFLFQ